MKRYFFGLRASFQKILCCHIPRRYHYTVKFPHPVGIVIGDGVRIGHECRIYQNVTIGLIENLPAPEARHQYPTLDDNVVVYAGAVIAGAIHIGAGCIIGANAVITKDVPAGFVAYGRNEMRPRQNQNRNTPSTGDNEFDAAGFVT
jgi:serine acetyltransferase